MNDQHAGTGSIRGRARTAVRLLALASAALAGAALACAPVGDFVDALSEAPPRERYLDGLRQAGLAETAIGREWVAAGDRALREPVPIEAPYRETGYFPADRAEAVGLRVPLRRGQVLEVDLQVLATDPIRVFLDVFALEVRDDSTRHRLLVSTDSAGRSLAHEVERDGAYVVRIQPELLRSGRYVAEIRVRPSLAFPVPGHDTRAIRSAFGDVREAGRRTHHGVDIFAPRGTPVLAAAEGQVRVGTNRLGGKVVWQRVDGRPHRLYYAHLDSQLVRTGQVVQPGDTLGLVGNSGNAVTTPPHLHFGVYVRRSGPVDPYPFLYADEREPPRLSVDLELLGSPVRVARRANLRERPDAAAPRLAVLEPETLARAAAASGEWLRLSMPDGGVGFVRGNLLAAADSPVRSARLPGPRPLLEGPLAGALAVDTLPPGVSVPVYGGFGDFLYVRAPGGRAGWVPAGP